eukprot:scaffold115454_cov17-Tisochrysis_lutea.AAC.1
MIRLQERFGKFDFEAPIGLHAPSSMATQGVEGTAKYRQWLLCMTRLCTGLGCITMFAKAKAFSVTPKTWKVRGRLHANHNCKGCGYCKGCK